jgi:hypothetical protein
VVLPFGAAGGSIFETVQILPDGILPAGMAAMAIWSLLAKLRNKGLAVGVVCGEVLGVGEVVGVSLG